MERPLLISSRSAGVWPVHWPMPSPGSASQPGGAVSPRENGETDQVSPAGTGPPTRDQAKSLEVQKEGRKKEEKMKKRA